MVTFLIRMPYFEYPFILFFNKEFRFLKLNIPVVEKKDEFVTFYEKLLGNVNNNSVTSSGGVRSNIE